MANARTVLLTNAALAAGQWSAIATQLLGGQRDIPAVFGISCSRAHSVEYGTCDAAAPNIGDCHLKGTVTGKAADTTHGDVDIDVWGDGSAYAWCRVKNDDGSNAAAVTVYDGG